MSSVAVRPASGPAAARLERAALWNLLSFAGLAILVILVLATYGDYGVSNDEDVQHRYGVKLLSFYLSGFADRSALSFENLYLYGGLFDMVAAAIERLLPGADIYALRHLLSGLIGVSGIAAAWRIAHLLAGPRAGFIALALLALTAPWYGAMFNHTKDIPFAAATAWLLYFCCRCIGDLPRPGWRVLTGLALSAGAALGLRTGALLYGFYLGIALAFWMALRWRESGGARLLGDVRQFWWRLALVAVAGYALMAFFWPWSVQAPLNPIRALIEFSHFKYDIDTLFAGQVMKMYEVPGLYAPAYFVIRLPLVVLAGLVLAIGFYAVRLRRVGAAVLRDPREMSLLLVALAAFFPLACCILSRPYLYSGLRHFYFVMPPLIVLAALGLDRLVGLAAAKGRRVAAALAAVLATTGTVLAAEMVALHPHQYVSYNLLVGGLPGAIGKWATDYWSNIAPEAVAGVVRIVTAERRAGQPAGQAIRIAFCGDDRSLTHETPPGFVLAQDWDKADFFISPTHIGCHHSFPKAPIVLEIKRLGVTLGIVRDLRNRARPR